MTGDVSDFADFYAEHADPVYRALTATLGDATLAADATAEAMTRACARWTDVRSGSNPPGWVYRVGLNWSRSRWRKLRRERPLDRRPDQSVSQPDPALADVSAAVKALPIEQRAVVVLRFYLQWTPTEIAAALELPVGTVKSRQSRGLDAMRAALADRPDADRSDAECSTDTGTDGLSDEHDHELDLDVDLDSLDVDAIELDVIHLGDDGTPIVHEHRSTSEEVAR